MLFVLLLHAKLIKKARLNPLVKGLIGPSTHRGILFSL